MTNQTRHVNRMPEASETARRAAVWRSRVPRLTVWYARIVGLLSILTAASERLDDVVNGIPTDVYLAVWFLIGIPSLGFGVLMLMIGAGLKRRKRFAWWLLTGVLFFFGPIGTYAIGLLLDTSGSVPSLGQVPLVLLIWPITQLLLIGVMIWAYPEFTAKGDPANPRLALTTFVAFLAISATLGTTLVASTDRNSTATLGDHLLYTLERGLAGTGLWDTSSGVEVPHWVNVLLNFLGSTLVLLTAYAFFRPRRGVALLKPADEAQLRGILDKYGDDSLGYFALRRDKSVIFSATGKSAITYRVVGGVSLSGGDPLGDPEAWPGAIEAWLAEARDHAWVPAVMGASERAGTIYARYGLGALELGDEAIVEVGDFTLEGRAMRVVRQAYNRVERAGYTTRIRYHADIPPAEMEALIELAELWREGAERGFSMALSRLGDPGDGACVMVECLDAKGVPRALLSFVPWGSDGLSLDLMRRQRGAENGLIEFMVIQLLQQAKEFGVARVSLNFAMFRSVFERGSRLGAGPVLRVWRRVLIFFSRWWQIESLYRANAKYRPIWEPRYVCFPRASDLPRIGIAAARAEGFLALPRPAWLNSLRPLARRLRLRKVFRVLRRVTGW